MSLPEILQSRSREGIDSAELFQQRLNYFVTALRHWETQWQTASIIDRRRAFYKFKDRLLQAEPGLIGGFQESLPEPSLNEKFLFQDILTYFSLKHQLDPVGEAFLAELEKPAEGKVVGMVAPLGCCKTTLATEFIRDLKSRDSLVGEVTREPWGENPFWSLSYKDPSYMLRSQIFFLLSNIKSEIKARLAKGISVSDTSIFTDILMWVEWHYRKGRLNDEEYKTYHSLVKLLMPIIPKPELLVVAVPDSEEHLKKGVGRRGRPEEAIFADPDDDNLAVQTAIVTRLIESIPRDWGINVLPLTVNPLEIFENLTVSYAYIYEMRRELGILGDLLDPSPEEVKKRIIRIVGPASKDGSVIVVHSPSMFSGKTTALCLFAAEVGEENILAFQPDEAIRDAESGFEDHRVQMISRTGPRIPAITVSKTDQTSRRIKASSLKSISEYIKKNKITARDRPYIFIDDIMLFTAHSENHQEALDVLEELAKKDFQVIADGIDYTFQELPFTFMHTLLQRVSEDANWYQIKTMTRCRFCNRPAQGTRLYISDESGRRIAPFDFGFEHAGNLNYEPVCCEEHKSCVNQPKGFTRQKLPV